MAQFFEARREIERSTYENRMREILPTKQICSKLKAYYDVEIPEGYEEQLTACENEKSLSYGDIEQIIKVAEFWKQCFVDKEKAYSKLVLGMVRSMLRIHCCVLNTNPATNAYVGRYGGEVDLDSQPFKEYFVVTTSITMRGKAGFVSSPGRYSFDD